MEWSVQAMVINQREKKENEEFDRLAAESTD
jgi:hypothetical protein